MSYITRRYRLVKGDKDAAAKDPPKSPPGLQVTTDDNPIGGVHTHKLAGQLIGHTVNAVGKGWTAVPFSGNIKGGFSKHADAQQYLADQHAKNIETDAIMEQAATKAGGKVKKDDDEFVCKDWTAFDESRDTGKNGYVVFHPKGKTEVRADTSYAAQRKVIASQKIPKGKQHMVTPMLADVEGRQITHTFDKAEAEYLERLKKDGDTQANETGDTQSASSSTTTSVVSSTTTSSEDDDQNVVEKFDDYDPEYVAKREFSTAKRKSAAKAGAALPDGSYPIENESDLHNAVEAFGRAKNPAKVKAHIRARAKALGATGALPDKWGKSADIAEIVAGSETLAERINKSWDSWDASRASHHSVVQDPKTKGFKVARNETKVHPTSGKETVHQVAVAGKTHPTRELAQAAADRLNRFRKDDEETGDEEGDEGGSVTKNGETK